MKTSALSAALALLAVPVFGQVVEYYHLDEVGTVLATTDQAARVVEQHEYLPFGEELCGSSPCAATVPGQPNRFTGKERDGETGQDYFGARYYQSRLGRFTGVDPRMGIAEALLDPQKWGRYAYSLNNPLRYLDPDGREEITIQINSFIPDPYVTTPWPMKGDDRDLYENGSFRTRQTVVIETDKQKSANGLVSATPETGDSLGFGGQGIRTSGKASTEGMIVTVGRAESGEVQISARGSVSYPNLPAAPIRYDLNVSVGERDGHVTVEVTGQHTRFPGFEVLAQREGSKRRQPVYGRKPGQGGLAPLGIMSTMDAKPARKTLESD
jgi:RHS repeat-associated protein